MAKLRSNKNTVPPTSTSKSILQKKKVQRQVNGKRNGNTSDKVKTVNKINVESMTKCRVNIKRFKLPVQRQVNGKRNGNTSDKVKTVNKINVESMTKCRVNIKRFKLPDNFPKNPKLGVKKIENDELDKENNLKSSKIIVKDKQVLKKDNLVIEDQNNENKSLIILGTRNKQNRNEKIETNKNENKEIVLNSNSRKSVETEKIGSSRSNLRSSKRLLNLKTTNSDDSGNVFEFKLSQSPMLKNDPAGDIISKLAKAGKINMVKYKKGSGKLQTRFRAGSKVSKKGIEILLFDKVLSKIVKKDELANSINKNSNQSIVNDNLASKQHTDVADEDDFNFEDMNNDQNTETSYSHSNLHTANVNITTNYSPLARNVMKKQNITTNKMQPRRNSTERTQLLNYAKKFVQNARSILSDKIKKQSAMKSPWRIPDESKLPRTFNFSRDSQNLPSYSSDFIAATPKKQIPLERHQNKEFHSSLRDDENFQLNHSNAENIPIDNTNILEVNPQKGVTNRVPLEIIDITRLPNLAFNQISTPKNKISVPRIEESIETDDENISVIMPLPNLPSSSKSIKAQNELNSTSIHLTRPEQTLDTTENISNDLENLFGFEDVLCENENADCSQFNETNKINLKTKLKKLKRLLPKSKAKPTRFEIIKPLINMLNDDVSKSKQKNIKQIFSSTMIETKNTELNKSTENITLETIDVNVEESQRKNIKLFVDLTSEIVENSTIRTYSRPKKKMRHNFITCLDSDDEEIDKSPNKKQKTNKKDKINEEELNMFYNNFNSACEEVDNFDLIIEKENKTLE